MRRTERDIVCEVLRQLDVPDHDRFRLLTRAQVISLGLAPEEWEEIGKIVKTIPLNELTEAWRALPREVWSDEHWIDRVAVRLMKHAADYEKLIETPRMVAR